MKLRSIILLSAATSLASFPALAQSYSGALTFGYGSHSVSDADQELDTISLSGTYDADFGNGFSMGVDLAMGELDIGGVPFSIDGRSLGLEAKYAFAGGYRAGVYAERIKLSVPGFAVGVSATSYGVTGGYAVGPLAVDAHVGKTTTDPDLPDGVTIRDFGLVGRYDASEALRLGGGFVRTRIESSGDQADIDTLGLGGVYDINTSWTVFGGIARNALDLSGMGNGDITTFGLGASYQMTAVAGLDYVLSLELARSTLDVGGPTEGDLDTIRLGLTIPLGGEAPRVPLNSVAYSVMSPRHSSISSAILTAF